MTAIAGRFWSYTASFQGKPVVYNFLRALPGLDAALEANRLGMHGRYSYEVEFSLLSCSKELEVNNMGFLVICVNYLGQPQKDENGRPKEGPVERIETENKFVNDLFNHLQENNGKLAIENEDTKKNLALAEERQK
ncbi:hypothetical protein FCOIX_2288 [Fusarium coicis]|nr:hypothetical protein FCOIX_2288 [Fusarium coicis]